MLSQLVVLRLYPILSGFGQNRTADTSIFSALLYQLSYKSIVVRMKGLEPPRLTTPEPKSGAATNYATSALTPQI